MWSTWAKNLTNYRPQQDKCFGICATPNRLLDPVKNRCLWPKTPTLKFDLHSTKYVDSNLWGIQTIDKHLSNQFWTTVCLTITSKISDLSVLLLHLRFFATNIGRKNLPGTILEYKVLR